MKNTVEHIVSAGLTHAGRVRKHNEDCFSCDDTQKLWLVADGMGGYAAGEVASKITIQTVNHKVKSGKSVEEAFAIAHKDVTQAVEKNSAHKGMASTVVGLHVLGEQCHVSWVGDSRAFLLRGDSFTQVSRDHSYFEWLIDQGLSREEALSDPKHEQLTQGIGLDEPNPGSSQNEIQSGDRWLLCSDGLYKEVSQEKIHEIVDQREEAKDVCEHLLQHALKSGGRDNISVVVIDFDPDKRLKRYSLPVLVDRFQVLVKSLFSNRQAWLPPLMGVAAAIIIFAVFLIFR